MTKKKPKTSGAETSSQKFFDNNHIFKNLHSKNRLTASWLVEIRFWTHRWLKVKYITILKAKSSCYFLVTLMSVWLCAVITIFHPPLLLCVSHFGTITSLKKQTVQSPCAPKSSNLCTSQKDAGPGLQRRKPLLPWDSCLQRPPSNKPELPWSQDP